MKIPSLAERLERAMLTLSPKTKPAVVHTVIDHILRTIDAAGLKLVEK